MDSACLRSNSTTLLSRRQDHLVLWELWTGKFPWEGVQNPTILWRVCNEGERLPIPEDCPQRFKDLLRQCWKAEWKQRPDITQVLMVITSLSRVALEARRRAEATAAHEARQKKLIAGPWDMVREFGRQDGPGKLKRANHITLCPGGEVVIADGMSSQIQIYSMNGEHKSSICTNRQPQKIAVSSENTCFMTDWSQRITMYELDGKYKGSWESSCPRASSRAPELHGLAIDHAGDLLLGDVKNKYVYKHHPDGSHVASIMVSIEPWYIAAQSKGTIVIAASLHSAPQIISSTGEVLHTLKRPDESPWMIYNLLSHDDIIFVCKVDSILCYSESGKYLGSMPIPDIKPWCGITMTSDSKTLVVCEGNSVKVFTASPVQ